MRVGILRVALDRRPKLTLGTVDVLPVVQEYEAEVKMRVGIL